MSKIHITLVGGQTAPIYSGIIEFDPDQVIFICSEQTKEEAERVKSKIACPSELIIIDPIELKQISDTANRLLDYYQKDEMSLNLTGGTKPWNLLFFKVFVDEENATLFYIDQNNKIWDLKSYQSRIFTFNIESLFSIYGTPLKHYTDFNTYTARDIETIEQIERLRSYNYGSFNELTNIRNVKENHFEELEDGSYIRCNQSEGWVELCLQSKQKGTMTKRLHSENINSIIFKSGWFELKIAHLLSKWNKAKNIQLNCVFKAQNNVDKNEIDIIVNTGSKLLFVECKTQIKTITDIDKFHSAVKNFGGMGSKALFITDASMREEAKEKCQDNDILSFSLQDNKSGFWSTEQSLFMILDQELTTLNKK